MSIKTTKNFASPYDYTYVPHGLCNESVIVVKGKVQQGCKWLAVSLHYEANPDCDIALHFNPRIANGTVVRNSKVKGVGWREEERDLPNGMPFKTGEKFTISVWVTENDYKVLVNNTSLFSFKHRMPAKDVRYIVIGGNQGDGHADIFELDVNNSCVLPFDWQLPQGFKKGRSLTLKGMVNDDASGFKVNFNHPQDKQKVACCFNPQQQAQQVVVQTIDRGQTQDQKVIKPPGQFPYDKGQSINTQFIAWDNRILIFNGRQLLDHYELKDAPELISHLDIEGDVTLRTVQFEDDMPFDYLKEIPCGLDNNDVVNVKGFFYPESKRFSVNLRYGTQINDDIALHFNPRRDQNCLVMNSRTNGSWDTEERHKLSLAFSQLMPFTCSIVIKSKKFKCYVNGDWVCDFKARGRKTTDIRSVNVQGDIYSHQMEILKRQECGVPNKVPGQLQPGSWVSYVGTLKKNCDKFAISFQGKDKEMEIPFHMEPIISKKQTVVQCKQQGQWQQQQTQQWQQQKVDDKVTWPFEIGHQFFIDILVTDTHYRVFVDDKHHVDFKHVTPPSQVEDIQQTGQANVYEPQVHNPTVNSQLGPLV